MDETGYLNLRKIEETEVLKLNIDRNIIATGGSVVYSQKAMEHLKKISEIVFLDIDLETVKKRIHNFETRGIAKTDTQTFEDVFLEREELYRKYAEYTVNTLNLNQDETADKIKSFFY